MLHYTQEQAVSILTAYFLADNNAGIRCGYGLTAEGMPVRNAALMAYTLTRSSASLMRGVVLDGTPASREKVRCKFQQLIEQSGATVRFKEVV